MNLFADGVMSLAFMLGWFCLRLTRPFKTEIPFRELDKAD